MPRTKTLIVSAVLSLALNHLVRADQTLDSLMLGNPESEKSHALKDERSGVVKGALDQPARQLLPMETPTYHGGKITFNLKIDPDKPNYLTLKLWGSDKGEEHGELMLYAGNKQVGYRSEGDYDCLNHCDAEGQAPGRFYYQTANIPVSLTKGKSNIELTIKSFGPVWWYGPNFEKFQKPLTVPSRGIYAIYTHTDTRFTAPPPDARETVATQGVRPSPGEEVIDQSKKIVIDRLGKMLQQPQQDTGADIQKKREARLALLSEAYHVSWTPAFENPKVITQVLQDCDDLIRAAAQDKKAYEGGWLGLGPVGGALHRLWPAIKEKMDDKIDLGVEGAVTRRDAYAIMLRRSVDYWRTHRRGYTNQSQIVDSNIWQANRGIELLKPDLALPEKKAMQYLYEAVGIEPWHGSDEFDDSASKNLSIKDDRNEAGWRFGELYHNVTRKGLSREVGWVGTYGETILTFMREMVELTGDEKIRQQLRKIQDTRMFFRYPGLDSDGYRCMKLASEIDNRTAHYPMHGSAYNAPEIRESWWMEVPAILPDDPIAVGAAQQALADNQYFNYIAGRLKDPSTLGMMRNVDEYNKVKVLPKSTYQLPGTPGQPDFVYADEQDAVVSIKHGNRHLFINFFYRSFYGINGVARVLEVNGLETRLATVRSEYKIEKTAGTYIRPNYLHSQYTEARQMLPPDINYEQALAGDELPIAAPPEGLAPLNAPVWGPFAGKADFYQLRWGDYLIGLNTTSDKTFSLAIPDDAPVSAVDLVTGKKIEGKAQSIAPSTTSVIYLGR